MTWISEAYTDSIPWEHLRFLCDVGQGRLAGTDAEREAAARTAERLEEAGARNARLEGFDIVGWFRHGSSVTATDSSSYECFSLPRSPSEGASGEFVDLGWGLPEQFEEVSVEGKVVMAQTNVPDGYPRIVHRIEKYALAVEHGAAAFILKNHQPGDMIRSGTIRGATGEAIGQIPTVGVSFETGERMARRHEGDTIEVEVDADIHPTSSQNVHAEFGPDTDSELIVSCHVDGHDISESAGDNAAGTAVMLAVARNLARREEELDRRVHFIGFGAEEVGLLGSEWHARSTDLDAIKVVIQNDGVGRARNVVFNTNGWADLIEPAEAVGAAFNQPVSPSDRLVLGSDHWRFVQRGVPAIAVASEPTNPLEPRAYGSSSGIVITPADTLDKIDPRDLRDHAILETELVVRLASEGVEVGHKSTDEIDTLLDDADLRRLSEGLAIAGDPPW